ncbi:hypothetical protein V6N13_035161 [Hibiscus sabdariffa]
MTEGVMAMDAELHETVRRDVSLAPPVADVGGGSQQPGLSSFRDKLLEGSGKLALAQAVTELEVDVRADDVRLSGSSIVIDGHRDPTELYGPWMQVSHRRRRPVVSQTIPISGAGTKGGKSASGSRFMALEEEPEGVVDMGGVQEDQSSNSRREGLSGKEGRVEEVVVAPPCIISEKPRQQYLGPDVRLTESIGGRARLHIGEECRDMGTSQAASSFAVAQGKGPLCTDWMLSGNSGCRPARCSAWWMIREDDGSGCFGACLERQQWLP